MSLTDIGPQAGFEAKLYLKISATWTEMIYAQDVKGPNVAGEIETSIKGSRNKKYIQGQSDQSLEFEYLWIKGHTDPVFNALQAAKEAGTVVEVASADGAIATAGTTYIRDNYIVVDFSKNEELESAVTYSAKLKPAIVLASGALVERSAVVVP
jgi:hypothetical protein